MTPMMDVRPLVNDARVLLGLLQRSQWGDLHVRTPDGEIFIARHGAGANPMLLPGVANRHAGATHSGPETGPIMSRVIRAPHVASVIEVLPAQSEVAVGTVICRLGVLGEIVEVASPHSGVIGELLAALGTLVEYDSPLVTIISSK
jgi:biotin carboxyl carrier protein